MRRTALAGLLAALAGCSGGGDGDWLSWHDDKRAVDQVVDQAINEPGGGNYAKAADAIRNSSRPPAIKQFQIGQLATDAFMLGSPRPPAEGVDQGLRMMEDATIAAGQKPESGPQYLRLLFERGGGSAPHALPKNERVAACWRDVENARSTDPGSCIALRRSLIPQIGTGPTSPGETRALTAPSSPPA